MTTVRKATLLSLAQRYVSFTIQLGAAVVLARLLTPAETGVFAVGAAIVSIAQMLRDFGIGEYVVQAKDLPPDRLRSVLGVSFLIAWTIAALLGLSAPYIGRYFNDYGIRNVVLVLALNFLLLPVGTITFALLTKEMAFKELFVVQSASAVVGALLSIALAWSGQSYMSLAWSSVAASLTTILALAIYRPAQTLVLPRFSRIGEIGRFGGTVTVGRVVDQFCRRAPDLLIAQGLGLHSVGVNSKASSLLDAFYEFFAAAITRVAMPAFARGRHAEVDPRASYLSSTEMLVIFPLSFFLLLALLAEPLVVALFGSPWIDAVPLLRVGAIAGLLWAPYVLATPLLTAHGRVKHLLWIQLIGGLFFLVAVYFAASRSLLAVAGAGVLAALLRVVLMQNALDRCMAISFSTVLSSCGKGAAIAAIVGALTTPALMLYQGTTASAVLSLALAGVISVTVASVGIFWLEHPLKAEIVLIWRSRARLFL